MATSPLPVSRRAEVMRMVTERGSVSVPELAGMFRVSVDTIRRDLDHLADSGALTRAYGGAISLGETGMVSVADRIATEADAKIRIAAAAVGLVAPGETLLVNGGSTTLAFARKLPADRSHAIITNSIPILDEIDASGFSHVYAIGGELLDVSKVTVGPVVFPNADRISVDVAVLGVRALGADRGLSTATVAEATMISEMMRLARRTIVLADATKFTRRAFASIAPLSEIDILVTNAEPPDEIAAALEDGGGRLVIAE